jgi:hypothetical protein
MQGQNILGAERESGLIAGHEGTHGLSATPYSKSLPAGSGSNRGHVSYGLFAGYVGLWCCVRDFEFGSL